MSNPNLSNPVQSKYAFIHSFIHSFIQSVSHSYLHSLIRLLIYSCLVRRCSSLAAPQFGFIYPYMCTSFPVSGTICHLECRNGFSGNGGVHEMRCGMDGKWSSDESLMLKCLGTIRCSVILPSGRGVVYHTNWGKKKNCENI